MPVQPDQASHWKDIIVDHSQFPRAHRRVDPCTHEGRGDNPFCGDRVTVQLRIGPDDVIMDAGCQSVGCAISMASASLMASALPGKSVTEARSLFEQVHAMLTSGAESKGTISPQELEALQMVRQYPSRVKCATLAWHALVHALTEDGRPASTE